MTFDLVRQLFFPHIFRRTFDTHCFCHSVVCDTHTISLTWKWFVQWFLMSFFSHGFFFSFLSFLSYDFCSQQDRMLWFLEPSLGIQKTFQITVTILAASTNSNKMANSRCQMQIATHMWSLSCLWLLGQLLQLEASESTCPASSNILSRCTRKFFTIPSQDSWNGTHGPAELIDLREYSGCILLSLVSPVN